jgi:hypothetical protein
MCKIWIRLAPVPQALMRPTRSYSVLLGVHALLTVLFIYTVTSTEQESSFFYTHYQQGMAIPVSGLSSFLGSLFRRDLVMYWIYVGLAAWRLIRPRQDHLDLHEKLV